MTAFRAVPAFAVRAAEEIVTAVALRAGTVGDRAGFTRIAATGSFGHACVLAAFLTLGAGADTRALCANFAVARAVGIRAAFPAPAPAGSLAAGEIGTARHLGVVAGFADLPAAGADGRAGIVTAFLLIGALVVAGSLEANATRAVVIGAALAFRLAGIGVGAAIFARLAIADARSLDAGSALAVTIGIAAALVVLAGSADAGLARPAIGIATAGRAVVVRGTRVATPLPVQAGGTRIAKAIAVAERFAAFVFALVRAIAVDAALGRAMVPTTATVVAAADAHAPAADVARIADLWIAGARNRVADGAGILAEILVDALFTIAGQGLAGDSHAVTLRSGLVEPGCNRHTPHQTAKQSFERRAA